MTSAESRFGGEEPVGYVPSSRRHALRFRRSCYQGDVSMCEILVILKKAVPHVRQVGL